MTKPLDKIIIVGGGSAGWITAAAIIRSHPSKEVILIESPNVPTIGVGESTLGQFKKFCLFLGLDEVDFMRGSDASYKMSIKFNDFYEKNDGGFHYPFGVPFEKDTLRGMHDWFIKKKIYPETPIHDFVDCFFPAAALFENNKYSLNSRNELDNFNPLFDVSYHFDAIKFAVWLRDSYCIPRGVKHIQGTVTDIKVDEDGIQKLVLNTGDEFTGNLYVDCTGFKSLLIGEALKQEFTSYSNILPNNRAWACQVPYKNIKEEMQGYTNCTAIENGWVWNTPIWTRLGTGYVYSDKFVDPEQAKEEFKKYLMSNKMAIPRTREEVDNLSFRDLSMRIGAYKKPFVKNVVAIGLSAGFIEPLESNGLMTIHDWAMHLCRLLTRPAITQFDKDSFNHTTFTHWKGFADFVAMHYMLSIRDDTEYWKSNFNRSFLTDKHFEILNEIDGFTSLIGSRFKRRTFTTQIDGRNWISTGMHWFVNDAVSIDLNDMADKNNTIAKHERVFHMLEERKNKWRKHAASSLSLYDYQKKNIYY